MDISFWGIGLSLCLMVIIVGFLLSGTRSGAVFVLSAGACAVLGGLCGWAFGGLIGSLGHNSTGGRAIQQLSFIASALGLVGVIVGVAGLSKRSEHNE